MIVEGIFIHGEDFWPDRQLIYSFLCYFKNTFGGNKHFYLREVISFDIFLIDSM